MDAMFNPWLRHYSTVQLRGALERARRVIACPQLAVRGDADVNQLGVEVAGAFVALTPPLASRELFITLTVLSLLPRMWELDGEHGRLMKEKAERPKRGTGRPRKAKEGKP